MPNPKKILYLADSATSDMAWIYSLKQGHDVYVAGERGRIAVDDAMSVLQGGQEFDLIVTAMYMNAGGQLGSVETDSWASTGLAFINRIRDEGDNTPVLVFETLTGLLPCRSDMTSNAALLHIESGESIDVLDKGRVSLDQFSDG